MALNPHFSAAARNAAVNAVAALMNSGTLKVYDGTQPADASVAITTQNLLVTLSFGATAFGSASGGSASVNGTPITAVIGASGTASWFRCLESDGTTVVQDGSVATATANLVVDSTAFSSGATLSLNSGTLSHPA